MKYVRQSMAVCENLGFCDEASKRGRIDSPKVRKMDPGATTCCQTPDRACSSSLVQELIQTTSTQPLPSPSLPFLLRAVAAFLSLLADPDPQSINYKYSECSHRPHPSIHARDNGGNWWVVLEPVRYGIASYIAGMGAGGWERVLRLDQHCASSVPPCTLSTSRKQNEAPMGSIVLRFSAGDTAGFFSIIHPLCQAGVVRFWDFVLVSMGAEEYRYAT
jgi:hypothetical protein